MLKKIQRFSIVATAALFLVMLSGCGDWSLYDDASEENGNGNGNGGDEPTFFDCVTGFTGLSGFTSTAESVDSGYQRPGAVLTVPEEMNAIDAFGIAPGDILMTVRKISNANDVSGIVNITEPDAAGFPIELGQDDTIYGMSLQREDFSAAGDDYTFNSLIYTYHDGDNARIHVEPLNSPFTSFPITDIRNGTHGIPAGYFNTLTSLVVNSTFDKFVLFVVDIGGANGGRVIRLSISRDIDFTGGALDLEIEKRVLVDGLVEPMGIALSDDDELLILDWDQNLSGSLYKIDNASDVTSPAPSLFINVLLIPGGVAFASSASGAGSILVTGEYLSNEYVYEYDMATGVFETSLFPLASGESILQLGPLAYNCSDGSLWVSDRGGNGVNDYTGKVLAFR